MTSHDNPVPAPAGYGPVDRRTGPRTGTIIWGILVTLFGLVTIAMSSGWRFDGTILVVSFLVTAGMAILAGSIYGVIRSRDRDRDRL